MSAVVWVKKRTLDNYINHPTNKKFKSHEKTLSEMKEKEGAEGEGEGGGLLVV